MTDPQAARETLRPDPLTPEPMTFGALTFDVDPSHDWGNLFCADCGRWPDEYGSTVPCPGPSWRTAAERAARQEAADTSGLREALERLVAAALDYSPQNDHDWRCEYRTAEAGYVAGGPPVIRCECGFDALGLAVRDAQDALAAGATETDEGTDEGTDDDAWSAGYDEGFAASKRLCEALERAGATERPLDVERLREAMREHVAAGHVGILCAHAVAAEYARLSPATATPEAGDA